MLDKEMNQAVHSHTDSVQWFVPIFMKEILGQDQEARTAWDPL